MHHDVLLAAPVFMLICAASFPTILSGAVEPRWKLVFGGWALLGIASVSLAAAWLATRSLIGARVIAHVLHLPPAFVIALPPLLLLVLVALSSMPKRA